MKHEIRDRKGVIYTATLSDYTLLTHADRAAMEQAVAAGINLAGAYMNGSNLENANLAGANLAGASLRNASLKDACLDGANLEGADFTSAEMYRASLRNANLKRAAISWANSIGMTSMQGAIRKEGVVLTASPLVVGPLYYFTEDPVMALLYRTEKGCAFDFDDCVYTYGEIEEWLEPEVDRDGRLIYQSPLGDDHQRIWMACGKTLVDLLAFTTKKPERRKQ